MEVWEKESGGKRHHQFGGVTEEASRSVKDHALSRVTIHSFKGTTSSSTTSDRAKEASSAEVIRVSTNTQVLLATTRLSSLKGKRGVTSDMGAPR